MAVLNDIAGHAGAALAVGLARFVTGVYPEWHGCTPGPQQRVYFANHRSHGDFLMVWAALPRRFRRLTRPVAALDYWGGGGFRGFLGREVFDAVLIDRKGTQPKGAAVNTMLSALSTGASLIIFPEGTRNTGEEALLPFRNGLYHLARARPDIEFVPVWIDNIGRVMPKGEFLPVPLLCHTRFGTPIALGADEPRESFLERARTEFLALRTHSPP